jgi:hypothetical protein
MKLFLSWSGERSKEFAKAARIWMETIFDEEIEYFMSDDDVQPGQRWVRELSNSLDETDLGILFLTSENLSSQWIAFEAGWMARRLAEGTVFPLLLDIDPEKVSGPLSEFQCKRADLKGMQDIAKAINNKLTKSIKPEILERRVRGGMQDFQAQLNPIIQGGKNELQLEYIRVHNDSDFQHLCNAALNLVRKSRSSIEVLTPGHHFKKQLHPDSQNFKDVYLKGLIEHLKEHEDLSFREVIGFDPAQEPYVSDSTWLEYLRSLNSLRNIRKNMNLRQMPEFVDECLIIADRRYALIERSQSAGRDDRGFEKREVLGGLVLNDPEGSVATKLSKEFALFWDTGSWEVFIADLP